MAVSSSIKDAICFSIRTTPPRIGPGSSQDLTMTRSALFPALFLTLMATGGQPLAGQMPLDSGTG